VELVVLGGLVPEILTRGQAELIPTHLGTTDVDLHVSFGVDSDRDLGSLEHALETIGAEPDPKIDGWRWRIPVGGVGVKIDWLSPADGGQLAWNRFCRPGLGRRGARRRGRRRPGVSGGGCRVSGASAGEGSGGADLVDRAGGREAFVGPPAGGATGWPGRFLALGGWTAPASRASSGSAVEAQ